MRKAQILALTGIGTGLVGSIAGAVLARKIYKNSKDKIESGEMNNEDDIKKAKWKTRFATAGAVAMTGLAIASGVGLAMQYAKEQEEENNKIEYLTNPNVEDNEEWLMALSQESDLIDELIKNNEEQGLGLQTMKDEIDEFMSSMDEQLNNALDVKEIGLDIKEIGEELGDLADLINQQYE